MAGRAIIEATRTGGPRVRLDGCPRCRRPMVLDHCGVDGGDGGQYVDLDRIGLAQRLHLATCTG